MALELWWGSGSPYSWRALLALEYKQLTYESHLVQFAKQEHKSPQMLKMNPRGRVPVLKDGDYVCFESLAILHYLDRKYPERPLFGFTPEDAGTIARVICEYQWYAEDHIQKIIYAILFQGMEGRMEEVERALGCVIAEARTIETRLHRRRGSSARVSPRRTSSCFRASRCCCALSSVVRRRICGRVCCLSRPIFRRSPPGSDASRRCRGTSGRIRRTGRNEQESRERPQKEPEKARDIQMTTA